MADQSARQIECQSLSPSHQNEDNKNISQEIEGEKSNENIEQKIEREEEEEEIKVDRRRKIDVCSDEEDEADSTNVPDRLGQEKDVCDVSEKDKKQSLEINDVIEEEREEDEEREKEGEEEEEEREEKEGEEEEGEEEEREEEEEDEEETLSKDNPMFVPRGPYFYHDSRFDEQSEEEKEEKEGEKEITLPAAPKSRCQEIEKWEHDLFVPEEQKPRQDWEKERDRKYYENLEKSKQRRAENGERTPKGRRARLSDFVTQEDKGNKTNRYYNKQTNDNNFRRAKNERRFENSSNYSPRERNNKQSYDRRQQQDSGGYNKRQDGSYNKRQDGSYNTRQDSGSYNKRENGTFNKKQDRGFNNKRRDEDGRQQDGGFSRRQGFGKKQDGGRENDNRKEDWGEEDWEYDKKPTGGIKESDTRQNGGNKREESSKSNNFKVESRTFERDIEEKREELSPAKDGKEETIQSLFKPVTFATSKVFSLSSQSNRLVVKEVDNIRSGRGKRMAGRGRGLPGRETNNETSNRPSGLQDALLVKERGETLDEKKEPNDTIITSTTFTNSSEDKNESSSTKGIDEDEKSTAVDVEEDDKMAKPKRYSSRRQKPDTADTASNETPPSGGGGGGGGLIPRPPFQYGWLYPTPPMLGQPTDPSIIAAATTQNPAGQPVPFFPPHQQQMALYYQQQMRMLQEMYNSSHIPAMYQPPPPHMLPSHEGQYPYHSPTHPPSIHHPSTDSPQDTATNKQQLQPKPSQAIPIVAAPDNN